MSIDYLTSESFDLKPSQKSVSKHKPRILILYGSLRKDSKSKMLAEEASRIHEYMGAEVKVYCPKGLPTYDGEISVDHPKVKELRELSMWSEGQVWSSPEYHGNMSGLLKTMIDWIPLTLGAIRPTQGKTLGVNASYWWLTKFQCCEQYEGTRSLDENVHYSKPIECCQSI